MSRVGTGDELLEGDDCNGALELEVFLQAFAEEEFFQGPTVASEDEVGLLVAVAGLLKGF